MLNAPLNRTFPSFLSFFTIQRLLDLRHSLSQSKDYFHDTKPYSYSKSLVQKLQNASLTGPAVKKTYTFKRQPWPILGTPYHILLDPPLNETPWQHALSKICSENDLHILEWYCSQSLAPPLPPSQTCWIVPWIKHHDTHGCRNLLWKMNCTFERPPVTCRLLLLWG